MSEDDAMITAHTTHSAQRAKNCRRKPGKSEADPAIRWDRYLPDTWAGQVDAPLYVNNFREYEMPAERTVGYDASDKPCFTSHRFALTQIHSDDDEEFYETVSYYEEMAAWRLRDERWLVYRITNSGQCNSPRGFYVISPTMPR